MPKDFGFLVIKDSDHKPNITDMICRPKYPPQMLRFPDTYTRLVFSQLSISHIKYIF
jgi:hypothetical protein